MRSKIVTGMVAGLIAGLVLGIMMQVMSTPDGKPMMAMVAQVVHSDSLIVGWIYHLFNSAVIGAIFGWLLGTRSSGLGAGALWGALYGVAWWVLGALILMPIFLGMPVFAPLMMDAIRPVAVASLVGHLIYGVILGGTFASFYHPRDLPELRKAGS